MQRLFQMLSEKGGAIVNAKSLTAQQLKDARANNHVWVDAEGEAFAWISISARTSAPGWLAS